MNKTRKILFSYLDIQPEVIRIGEFKKSWGKLKCIDYHSIKTEREMTPWAINGDLKKIFSLLKNKIKTKDITAQLLNISLPVSQIITKTVEVPIINFKDIKEAIKFNTFWENLVQLPGAIEDYSIAYEIVKKNKFAGTSTLFVLIVKNEIVNHIFETSKNNGFEVNNIEPRFIALLKLFNAYKNLKNNKSFILVEIGPVENYLVLFSDNIPTVINLFLSQQDKTNLQNGNVDRDFYEKLTKKYASQIEQGVSSKLGKSDTVSFPDLYIYSTHNSDFDFEGEFKSQIQDHSVDLLKSNNQVFQKRFSSLPNENGIEIIYGMAEDIKFKNQKWLNSFDFKKFYIKKNGESINALSSYKIKALAILTAFFSFFTWNYLTNEQIKNIKVNLKQLTDNQNYYSQKQLQYENLLNQENIIKKKLTIHSFFEDNQAKLLDYQNIINKSLSKGIWFKSETFESVNGFIISGISISDKGIIEFFEALRETKLFSLVNIENIKVLDKQDRSNLKLREFIIKIKV